MQSHIREHTIGSIISGAFRVYFQNFMTIYLTCLIPVLPFYLVRIVVIMYEVSNEQTVTILAIVNSILGIFGGLVAIAAGTLIISDLLIGRKVNIVWIYKQVFSALFFKLFVTELLQWLVIIVLVLITTPILLTIWLTLPNLVTMVGWLIFVTPCLIAMVWLMFSSTVTVLEGAWGVEALKRSTNLGSTKHWRNFGVILIVMFVTTVPILTLIMNFNLVSPSVVSRVEFQIIFNLFMQLLAPIPLISIVLLYYDLRVRKESHNLQALV